MDNLQQIIHTFTPDEQKSFRRFIQRNRYKSSRVDLKLYSILQRNEKEMDNHGVMKQLYGHVDNPNAYHGVRKRLTQHLNDFITIKQLDEQESGLSSITKNLVLIRHLFEHNLRNLAWKYLKKSERMAQKGEWVAALQSIYDLQIEFYNAKYAHHTLEQLVDLRMENNQWVQHEQNLNIIGSMVKQAYEKVKVAAEDVDLITLADDLIQQFEMDAALAQRPQLMYKFLMITRQVILANKAFYSFEPYLEENYNQLKADGFFEQNQEQYVHILYVLAHTYYRNKKFNRAVETLKELHEALKISKKGIYNQYIPKYILLYAACENFKGNLELAIEVLESFAPNVFMDREELLNIKLNQSVYYFQEKEFKKANQLILQIGHTDKWLEKNIGVEWKLKKNMIEIIYQIELERPEIALDRINSLQKTHRKLFQLPVYQRVTVFLNLLKKYIQDPEVVKTQAFLDTVEVSFEWIEIEQEDLQAMSYYAWLKSKMEQKDFYTTLLSLMTQTSDAQNEKGE